MKTKDDILNQMDEVIQYFINHPDNQPNTDHCRNVDRLINLKADLANGDNKSDDECTLPVVNGWRLFENEAPPLNSEVEVAELGYPMKRKITIAEMQFYTWKNYCWRACR